MGWFAVPMAILLCSLLTGYGFRSIAQNAFMSLNRRMTPLRSIEKYISDPGLYKMHKARSEELKSTNILQWLAKLNNETLPGPTQLEIYEHNGYKTDFFDFPSLPGSKLFRRQCDIDLLTYVRQHDKALLLGNEGSGKSTFQLYYMLRAAHPEKFGPLPPDARGSTEPPHVIIRQLANQRMQFFYLKERLVHRVLGVYENLLDCFDPTTTLYFFDPLDSNVEPIATKIPTLATCPPRRRTYLNFGLRKDVTRFYMPDWEIDELLAVSDFLVKNEIVKEKLNSPKQIVSRYDEFGGIFPHVIVRDESTLDEIRKRKLEALDSFDPKLLLKPEEMDNPVQWSYLFKHVVSIDSDKPYQSYSVDFSSKETSRLVRDEIFALDWNTKSTLYNTASQKRKLFSPNAPMSLISSKIGPKDSYENARGVLFESMVFDILTKSNNSPWKNTLGTLQSSTISEDKKNAKRSWSSMNSDDICFTGQNVKSSHEMYWNQTNVLFNLNTGKMSADAESAQMRLNPMKIFTWLTGNRQVHVIIPTTERRVVIPEGEIRKFLNNIKAPPDARAVFTLVCEEEDRDHVYLECEKKSPYTVWSLRMDKGDTNTNDS